MRNFIQQVKDDHNLVDELVTNAFESGSKRIDVLRTSNQFIVINRGVTLTEEEIRAKLLTAFETGDEKSLDTNRGLGFIAIYASMESTQIISGKYHVYIESWDDIQLKTSTTFFDGTTVIVTLNKNAKNEYSYPVIHDNLKQWHYWGDTELFLGRDEPSLKAIGTKLPVAPSFRRHPKYNYKHLVYSDDLVLNEFELNFLLKLTNVDAFRVLPIHREFSSFIPNSILGNLCILISHNVYLDITRRSLSKIGEEKVKELIQLLNGDMMRGEYTRKTFLFIDKGKKIAKEKVELLNDYFTEKERNHVITRMKQEMTNINNLLHELVHLNQLIYLLGFLNPAFSRVDLVERVFEQYQEMIAGKIPTINEDAFRHWYEERFDTPRETVFRNAKIGLLYNHGSIEGEAYLYNLLDDQFPEYTTWIPFRQDLFTSNILINETIIIVLIEEIEYLANIGERRVNIGDLIERNVYHIENYNGIDQYSLDRQEDQRHDKYENEEFFLQYYQDKTEEEVRAIIKNLHIPKIKFKVLGNGAKAIPFLVYPDAERVFDIFSATYPDPCKIDLNHAELSFDFNHLSNYFAIWRKLVEIIIRSYGKRVDDLLNMIIPVLVLKAETSTIACKLSRFVALSIYELANAILDPLELSLRILQPAIHEIAHLFVRPHSNEFFRIEASIKARIMNDTVAMGQIQELFSN